MIMSRKELVILGIICLWCQQIQGITFGQSDITIQEGSSKNVSVRRSGTHPVSITVFAVTIEDYRRFEEAASVNDCRVPLSRLMGVKGSQVDSAEAADLLVREYTLTYGMEEQEKYITLQVTDDGIAENEEVFILYTSFTEALNDRCATAVRLQDNDVVQFSFSTATLLVGENEILPNRLSIIKTGQAEPTISFQVFVYPVEGGPDETDFIAHSDHLYVFTNETNELPIATELVEDLLAEDDEAINICLPNLRDYTMAELADPDCVRVTINDNDPMMVGFSDSNSSVVLTEGAPFSPICIEIKRGGFPLHPSGILELTIQTESIDGEVLYGGERLEFDSTHLTACKTITGRNDHISDGTQTSMLTIGMAPWSSVPVLMSPGRTPITVVDVDVTSFELVTSNMANGVQGASEPLPPMVQEGTRAENLLRIQKRGYTNFAYTVFLQVQLLTESEDSALDAGFTINTTVRFQGSTSQLVMADIPIDVLDDSMMEKQKQFIVSILRVVIRNTERSTGSSTSARTSIEGGPVRITIYDNDFNIGFVNKSIDAVPGRSLSICVAILGPKPPDIDPIRRIPISLLVSIVNTTTAVLQLEVTEVTLSATNFQACVGALVQAECENTTNFAVELNWNSDPSYNVNLQQHTLSIECQQQQAPTDCPTCVDMGGINPAPRSPADPSVVAIVISIIVTVVLSLIVVASIILGIYALCIRGVRKKPNREPDNRTRTRTQEQS